MQEYRQERRYLGIGNMIFEKLELNAFVLSRQFLYRMLMGLIGGLIAAVYWIAL